MKMKFIGLVRDAGATRPLTQPPLPPVNATVEKMLQ
jgi:hypothetical protein